MEDIMNLLKIFGTLVLSFCLLFSLSLPTYTTDNVSNQENHKHQRKLALYKDTKTIPDNVHAQKPFDKKNWAQYVSFCDKMW